MGDERGGGADGGAGEEEEEEANNKGKKNIVDEEVEEKEKVTQELHPQRLIQERRVPHGGWSARVLPASSH
ncbi:hypothetical protein E2C01_084935 [Portunus trituberculatus]|uniref:Uncharacterized protein n=1 Tax=Portunus trituberculatus TaxID=210409 RepID=A0A5B7J5F6_PORTR|nr:hypothetical protein [Portunus trituberculatus]